MCGEYRAWDVFRDDDDDDDEGESESESEVYAAFYPASMVNQQLVSDC